MSEDDWDFHWEFEKAFNEIGKLFKLNFTLKSIDPPNVIDANDLELIRVPGPDPEE